MKKIIPEIFLLVSSFMIPFVAFTQTLPTNFHLTVYDSTVTGYYFFATVKMGNSSIVSNPYQLVLDNKGKVVYYKSVNPYPAATDFKIQPDGRMSYYRGNKFMLMDSTFTILDSIEATGYRTNAHDLQILSNQHYLLLGLEDSIMDLSSYNYFNKNGSPGSSTAKVTGSVVVELDSNKNIVFEWHQLTHFQFSDVDEHWLNDPAKVDWTHSNTVELDADGNILFSSRHFNEVTKINRTNGNIMWRMGGKNNEFTFVNDSLIFRGQHDVRRIANGHITIFDNGDYTNPHGARGVEYAVDEVNKIATRVWSFTPTPYLTSRSKGNNQRISASRKLISYGHRATGDLQFTMIDSLNNVISELYLTDSIDIYRAFFYPTLPWSFHRPQITCDVQGTNVYLKTTNNYPSYKWSNGQTTSSILITALGTYSVLVNYGEGYIRSEDFIVVNVSNPCFPSPVANFTANATSVCKNTTVHFTDQSGNNPTSWQWSFPGGTPSSSTLKNPQVQYMTAGTYSVTLIAGNASGYGSITKTNYITVNATPPATITGNPLYFCTGGSVLLSVNTGTGLSYIWKKNNVNISAATSSSYTVTSGAVYKVLVTNQNGCTKISNSLTVTGPPSNVITSTGPLDLCPGDSVKFDVPLAAGNAYQWKKNNVNISGATKYSYVAYSAGDYKVRITNSFGCTRLSVTKTVTTNCLVGISERESSAKEKIFPNPSSKYFNVTLNRMLTYEIVLYDISGKKIETHNITNSDNFIFGKNLEAGFYLCEIFYENKKDLVKVIKTNR